jgi:hypothetical protein
MRQRAGVCGKRGNPADQPGRLRRKHHQHLALEAAVAERHAAEMREINRTIIGSKRRRWHPVNPFEAKRHGQSECAGQASWPGRFGHPITELVNETFGARRKFAPFLTRSCLNRLVSEGNFERP